jgi:sterol 14-demethylase
VTVALGTLPTPPMVRGLPLLGNFLEWRRDHLGVFERAYAEHGPVFSIRLGPMRGVMLIGPRYHEFYFREVDNLLSVPELYRFTIPMFGDVMMACTDVERRRRHVSLLQSAFQGRRLAHYTEVMERLSAEWLDRLPQRGRFELWDTLEPLVMRIAASSLLGPEVTAKVDEFRPLLVDLARGMDFVLPPNLPLPKFRRRDRARRLLTEQLSPLLAQRRRHRQPGTPRTTGDGADDFLQTLVDDPELLAEGEDAQVGMAMATLFTGYITTAAQSCWTLVLLLQHPGYLRDVVAELDAGGRQPLLEWAIKESVRLRSVMSHYARTNTEAYELDGYRIPKGWLTMLCPGVAHRLPEVFTDPERFDPLRFAPDRAEDRRQPHALIGFSGGFYRCPGQAFGSNEIRAILTALLSRFDLTLLTPDPQPNFDLGVIRPGSPCLVHFERRRC